jgi:hypothetical protein
MDGRVRAAAFGRCIMGGIRTLAQTTLAAIAVVGLVSCGGGGEADDTSGEITSEQLAQMVLALDQFGPEYAGFAPEEANGALNLEQTADEEDDPAAEQEDLGRFGWEATHKAMYEHPQPGEDRFAGLGSFVYLFNTPDGAEGYLRDSVEEIKADWQEEGVEKIEVSEQDIGDGAFDVRVAGSIERDDGSSVQLSASALAFRRGRLMGVVTAFTVGAQEEESQRLEGKAQSLGPVMNDRMASVLATGAPAAAQR